MSGINEAEQGSSLPKVEAVNFLLGRKKVQVESAIFHTMELHLPPSSY